MPNMLEQKIKENEKLYNSIKKKLEDRIGVAGGEYSSLLKDFNNEISYIQRDSMLSKEGKIQKVNEIRNSFINRANVKSLDHYASLQKELDIALLEYEKRKLENYKGLNNDMLPQLMYVNSMINSISSINDADLLEDVFNYVSEENNFSDELINMIYIKARNLVNNVREVENAENNNVMEAVERGKKRTKISDIIFKIESYKKDYSEELNSLKRSFTSAVKQKKFPTSLYMQRDPKIDFNIANDPWNNPWFK